jgi:hypothetical protein
MKPVWSQTLAWVAAVLAAFLFALASPGGFSLMFDRDLFQHGVPVSR